MAILKMKKLSLIAIESQRDALLRDLLLKGFVEISEPSEQSFEQFPSLVRRSADGLASMRQEQNEINNALTLLNRYSQKKTSFLAPLPNTSSDVLLDESRIAGDLDRARYILGLEEKIHAGEADKVREEAVIEQLAPWTTMDIPLDFKGTEKTNLLFASLPANQAPADVGAALAAEVPEAQIFEISKDKLLYYVVFLCLEEKLPDALAVLRPMGFNIMQLPEIDKTAAAETRAAKGRIELLEEEKKKLQEKITNETVHIEELRFSFDTLSTKIARAEADEKLMSTEKTVVLQGWVPEENEEGLIKLLSGYDCAYSTEVPSEEDYPAVPVKLKNNRLTRALNMVTEMYSLPAYGSTDPNPLMAPFFILFYGIMMADMGYGLLMMLIGIIVLAKKKPKAGTRTFFELLSWCGLSTFIVGALTGGFFGDAPLKVAQIINPQTTWKGLPALFTPLNDTVMILIGAMCLGAIHIITGMAVSFVMKAKAGNLMGAIFEEGSWWVIFAGLALMVLKIGTVSGVPVPLAIGGLMLVYGACRGVKGIFGKIGSVFNAVYSGVTGFFGDILSYSRLMALMLAGSVIASVFNIIGAIPQSIVIFLIISLVGNALNFALNLLGCYVHDLRLQCLEFFGKFYQDGGKPFKPLAINTKYVNVTTDN